MIMWFSGEFFPSDRSSEHQQPFHTVTQCVAVAAKRDDDDVIGRIKARNVTAGDVSRGSHSVDGLIWCNVRVVAWGVLIVCLFVFVSLAPCVAWCFLVCPHVFFTYLCQNCCLNNLSNCLFFLPLFTSLSVLSLPPSLCGQGGGVSVIKSSRLLCAAVYAPSQSSGACSHLCRVFN